MSRVMDNPALLREDWLPEETEWPELGDLRERHVRHLQGLNALAHERNELWELFEAEDERRAEALKTGYAAGEEPDDLPEVTPEPEREAQMAARAEKHRAALAAFEDFLNEAIDAIRRRSPEWLAGLDQEAAEATHKRQEAARLLAEAQADEERLRMLRMWVERTARDRSGWHVPFPALSHSPRTLEEIVNEGVPERVSADA